MNVRNKFYKSLFRIIVILSYSYAFLGNISSYKCENLASQKFLPSKMKLARIDTKLRLCKGVNLREVTIARLQEAFDSKQLSSAELVKCYMKRIQEMDPYLNSVIEINPTAEEDARKRDSERSTAGNIGKKFGPLHGIPILIKANIPTADMMQTTSGSLALLGLRAKRNSKIVDVLKKAGAIILGKTNLSEFASYRGTNVPEGWSGQGNQTHNAYVLSQNPDGSSSGSGVSVASNLIPVAIGSDTSGSIIYPSESAACVGLRPTFGRVWANPVIPLAFSQDVLGPMARTVTDAAITFNVISKTGLNMPCFNIKHGFSECSIKNLKVGILRDPNWLSKDVNPQIPTFEKIIEVLQKSGVTIVDPVIGRNDILKKITLDNKVNIIYPHEFKYGINKYLKEEVRTNRNYKGYYIHNLDDIVKFNKMFPSPEGYNQKNLIRSAQTNGLKNRTYLNAKKENQRGSRIYINSIFETYNLDAVMIPTDHSELTPAAAGYPLITIPAGVGSNKVPFGVSLYGLPDKDEILLNLAYWIEKGFPARKPPKFLP